MALQQYTLATVLINGATLTEEASVTVSRATDAQIVKTVAKGFAGVSPGARMISIKIDSAVPSADFEFNPGPFMSSLEPVEITVFAAGKTLTTSGVITSDNFAHAVDTASKLDFDAVCEWADWK